SLFVFLNGYVKIPTASSAQIMKATKRTVRQATTRVDVFRNSRRMPSHNKPVHDNRTPATRKSNAVQFTSSVNCMAIRGIASSSKAPNKMANSRLLVADVFIWIYKSTLLFKVIEYLLFMQNKNVQS